jgi:uncharacterized protein (TIGR03067 family)
MAIRSLMTVCLMLWHAPGHVAAQERTPLEGVWVVTSVTFDGQVNPGGGISLMFNGNSYAQIVNGEVNEEGTFQIDQTKKPMIIDFTVVESRGPTMIQLGVVEVEGSTLKLHLNSGTPTRPIDFNPIRENFLIVARRN